MCNLSVKHTDGPFVSLSHLRFPMVVAIVSMMVGGCTPLWPTLKPDGQLSKCEIPTPTDKSINYDCIRSAIVEMQEMLQRTGNYDRSLGYTAVAGGTYAAYLASLKNPNKSLLKHTAIGLGALIGFNQVVGADRQQDVLVAGINALRCIEKAAYAVDFAAANVSSTPVSLADLVQTSSVAAQARFNAFGSNVWSKAMPAVQPLVSAYSATVFQSQAKLVTATNSAKDHAAVDVYEAVSSIRDNVRTQLVTNKPNLKQIFDDQQKQVSGLVGGIVSADNVKKQNQQQLESLVGTQLDSVIVANDVSNPAKPAQDAFATCVTPTVPPSQ